MVLPDCSSGRSETFPDCVLIKNIKAKADIMTDQEEQKKEKRNRGTSIEVCGYPLSIFFIFLYAVCENFSYRGIKVLLVLYFKYFFGWDDDLSTSIFHTFLGLCYFLPILGAIVADSWLGKFKTIICMSIVSVLGHILQAVSAIHDMTDANRDGSPDNLTLHVALSMVGLFLIVLGMGGIGTCLAPFGGDQFGDHQEEQRTTFFSVLSVCTSVGSLLSKLISPILRVQECGIYSKQDCYPLAFGVNAALMVVALVVFIFGSGMYYKAEPQGNIMLDVCKCIGFAIKNRYRHRSKQFPKREHWMDWAEEKYDKLLIAQIKMVLKVLFLYIPLPATSMLLAQMGSRWTLQATNLDGNFGGVVILPDQMQIVNSILYITLVPVMNSFIYPLIKKCGLNFTPLKRMTVGMFLVAMAFVCTALVQLQIDQTLPTFPSASESQIKLLNMGTNPVTVKVNQMNPVEVPAAQPSPDYLTVKGENISVSIVSTDVSKQFKLTFKQRQTLLIPSNFSEEWLLIEDRTSKPQKGTNVIRFVNGMNKRVNITDFGVIEPFYYSNYTRLKNGKKSFRIQSGADSCEYSTTFGFGSSCTFFIHSTFNFGTNESIIAIEDIKPNTVHMALQFPQYVILTAGEVMFYVTGLEFSYTQAPSNMKSVLRAGWLLTGAVGNILVLIVAEAIKFPKQWAECVLFASVMVAVCFIFSIMACFYTYSDPTEIEDQFKKNDDDYNDHEESIY